MKTIRLITCILPTATLLCALLCGGCQTAPKVNTEAKAGVDFGRYRTFALLPLPSSAPTGDPGLMMRLAGPAREAVVASLTAKGLAEATSGQADLNVHLHGQSVPQVDVTQLGYSRPVTTRYGRVNVVRNPEIIVNEYEQRTLTLELLDTRTREVVWVGWATHATGRPVKVAGVTNVITRILAEFPPTTVGGGKR